MFDFEDIHPNIRILPGKKAYQDALVYISKEDPECAHLKRDTSLSIVRRVLQCETVVEALEKNCESINQANGIVTIFNLKEHSVEPEAPMPPKFQWQKDFDAELLYPKHLRPQCWRRQIIWLYDESGGKGKSEMARYLSQQYTKGAKYDWLVLSGVRDSREAAHQLTSSLKNGWTSHGIIVDLARTAEHSRQIYEVLECLKNGCITSTKYQGANLRFQIPWVVVMSNWWPNIQALSQDRWDIRELHLLETPWSKASLIPPPVDYTMSRRDLDYKQHNPYKHCNTCSCLLHQ